MNKQRVLNTKVAYPTGNDFNKLITKKISDLGYSIKMFPQITARNMNHDQQLYVSLVSLFSLFIGKATNLSKINNLTDTLKSEDMISLKDNTYGTYFENSSRVKLYQFIKNWNKKFIFQESN